MPQFNNFAIQLYVILPKYGRCTDTLLLLPFSQKAFGASGVDTFNCSVHYHDWATGAQIQATEQTSV